MELASNYRAKFIQKVPQIIYTRVDPKRELGTRKMGYCESSDKYYRMSGISMAAPAVIAEAV